MLNFLTIDLESITSSQLRSSFSEAQLERLADAIIAAGGVASPILLKKTGFEKYEILERHFEYYGAVRASEKEPKRPELTEVNALIVSEADEPAVETQLSAMSPTKEPSKIVPEADKPAVETQLSATSPTKEPLKEVSVENSSSFDLRLTKVELRFEKLINDLRAEEAQKQQKLEERLNSLESQIVPLQKPSKDSQTTPPPPKATSDESKTIPLKNPLDQLNNLDEAELSVKLERSRIRTPQKMAAAIANARKKKPEQKFENYQDVINSVKGLGDRRMLTIIDDWSRQ
ncbi:MAG: hypothetical protein SW833_11795 [Cyanobacteriota bacterium]|nr:hypothetical protein [Cyanobacteriota bacterium]